MSEAIGKCPLCGGRVFDNKKGYGCEHWKDTGCKFTIWHDTFSHHITEDEAKKLMAGKEIGPFDLTSKAGKPYTASMYYNKKEQKVELKFPEREKKEEKPVAPNEIPDAEPEEENGSTGYEPYEPEESGDEEDEGLPFD